MKKLIYKIGVSKAAFWLGLTLISIGSLVLIYLSMVSPLTSLMDSRMPFMIVAACWQAFGLISILVSFMTRKESAATVTTVQ